MLTGIMAPVVLAAMIGIWLQGGFDGFGGPSLLLVALWIATIAVTALRWN